MAGASSVQHGAAIDAARGALMTLHQCRCDRTFYAEAPGQCLGCTDREALRAFEQRLAVACRDVLRRGRKR